MLLSHCLNPAHSEANHTTPTMTLTALYTATVTALTALPSPLIGTLNHQPLEVPLQVVFHSTPLKTSLDASLRPHQWIYPYLMYRH